MSSLLLPPDTDKAPWDADPPKYRRGRDPVMDAYMDWLTPVFREGQPAFGTFGWTDEYAERKHLWTPRAAFGHLQRFMDKHAPDVPVFAVTEYTPYRAVPHLHCLIGGDVRRDELWHAWWSKYHSGARILPLAPAGIPYTLKYALKDDNGFRSEWWNIPAVER